MKTLAIDVGGTHIKVLATGQAEKRKIASGPRMTPEIMVQEVRELTEDWDYEVVSIGYPGIVGASGIRAEPANLGTGWVGFDFAAAFGKPVRLLNDAAMQALGSYDGGRMLFLGLGTGLGSALVAERAVVPLELAHMPWGGQGTVEDRLGRRGRKELGKKEWQRQVEEIAAALKRAFIADYVVLGGGEAKKVDPVPPDCRLGENENAFVGGFRLWQTASAPTQTPGQKETPRAAAREWRVV